MKPAFDIRPARKDDAPFIIQTWIRHQATLFVRAERDEGLANLYGEVIAACLETEGTKILVATAPSWLAEKGVQNPDRLIRGYIVAEPGEEVPRTVYGSALSEYRPTLLHMVYVKKDHREQGIARALFERVCTDDRLVTCTTLARGWPNDYIRKKLWSRAHRLLWARALRARS